MDSGPCTRGFSPSWLAGGERKGERLAQRVWCELGREERRWHAVACRLGNGRVRFQRRAATLWALPWTPLRWRGVGTNPEYAVKSTDKFLTSLYRIQVEIKDRGKVAGAAIVGAAESRSALATMGRSRPRTFGLPRHRGRSGGKRGKARGRGASEEVAANGKGVGTNPECAVKSTDNFLTSP
jgi:hypothetical protein